MPVKASDKCRQCSKLSVENAIARHGTEGDGCWAGEPCHKRRTYYKKRDLYNRNRRLKYRGEKQSAAQLNSITIAILSQLKKSKGSTTVKDKCSLLGLTEDGRTGQVY